MVGLILWSGWWTEQLVELLAKNVLASAATLFGSVLVIRLIINWQWWYIFSKTWPRDLKSLIRLIILRHWVVGKMKRRNENVVHVFRKNAYKHPDRPLFYHNSEVWSFMDVELFSNQIANCLASQGFKPGDEIALYMDSRPEFVCLWLGAAKAGVVMALINTNQKNDTLVHAILAVKSRALIYGTEYEHCVAEIATELQSKRPGIQFFHYKTSNALHQNGGGNTISNGPVLRSHSKPTNGMLGKDLKALVELASNDAALIKHNGNHNDLLFYIYTSGTTGLPKPAIIKHSRFIWIGSAVRVLSGFQSGNKIYTCIPLYHLAGGILGTNQCLIWGDSMVIRNKFSASNFWSDCIKYECDTAQYIGEICRYLLAQPEKSIDRQHKVRLMFGNGLRPEIWAHFRDRFGITNIREFYGSTEGNANIINNDNREGACGFISRILPRVYPVALIKIDENTGLPVRDENGVCIHAGGGEYGEIVGKVDRNDSARAFDGYVDRKATESKMIQNVWNHGDEGFRSGDLLTMDEWGYVYFKDRTGDTYRWKGENVSTMQVEAVFSKAAKQRDCVVYGVEVPFCDGKAGMAAILDPDRSIDLNQVLRTASKSLPPFAIPVFVRIVNSIEATGTYKMPKTTLQREAYNLSNVRNDPLYIIDAKNQCYKSLTDNIYRDLIEGRYKV